LSGRLQTKSLIPIYVRLANTLEGVVDVVNDLSYDFNNTRVVSYPRA
jgi:hypothetical protein